MNSNPKDIPPQGGRQGLSNFPIIRDPAGLVKAWMEADQAAGFPTPTRKIPPKRGSLAGYIPFPFLNRNVWHESALERDFLLSLKPFDGLVGVLEQPLKLHCPDLGFGKGPYTPDFLIWIRSKAPLAIKPVLVEVKFEEDLTEHWSTIRPKLLAGRRFANRQGWRFLLITPRHLRIPRPLPSVLSPSRVRPYDLRDPMKVLAHLFGCSLLRGPQ